MQSASSRIWTRVAMSISYDNNHYTTGTSCDENFKNDAIFFSEGFDPIILIGLVWGFQFVV